LGDCASVTDTSVVYGTNLSVLILHDLYLVFCFISTGKRKNQAPPEPEPSKRPKGPTAFVRREKAKVVQEAGFPTRQQQKEARK
jgi:hypothetical protein